MSQLWSLCNPGEQNSRLFGCEFTKNTNVWSLYLCTKWSCVSKNQSTISQCSFFLTPIYQWCKLRLIKNLLSKKKVYAVLMASLLCDSIIRDFVRHLKPQKMLFIGWIASWVFLLINCSCFPNQSLQSLFLYLSCPSLCSAASLICIQVASSPPCVWLCRAGVRSCGSDSDRPLISCLTQADRWAETPCFSTDKNDMFSVFILQL